MQLLLWYKLDSELDRLGKNWRWLGKIAAVPESTLSRWRDKDKYPSVEKVIKMAQAVGRSVEFLVTGKEPTGLSEKSMRIALAAENLNDEGKEAALGMIEGLIPRFPFASSALSNSG